MTITKQSGRQEILAANVDITLAMLTAGSALPAVELPGNAVVIGGGVAVVTAFNSTSTDTIAILGPSSEALLAPANIHATGWRPLTPTGAKSVAQGNVTANWASGGGSPSTGLLRLTVLYIVDGRSEISQG